MSGKATEFRPVTSEDQALFDKAMEGYDGSGFIAREVSTQVVNGIKYTFKCDATMTTNPPKKYTAEVTFVHKVVDVFENLGVKEI